MAFTTSDIAHTFQDFYHKLYNLNWELSFLRPEIKHIHILDCLVPASLPTQLSKVLKALKSDLMKKILPAIEKHAFL